MKRVLIVALAFASSAPALAQIIQQPPPASSKGAPDKQYLMMNHESPAPEEQAKNGKRISVQVHPAAGPVGQLYVPNILQNAYPKVEAGSREYRYPSLYLTMSATPVLAPVKKPAAKDNPSVITDVLYDDLDLRWMDVTVELDALGDNGAALTCSPENIQVLALLPSDTIAGIRKSRQTDVIEAVDQSVDVVLPFVPGPGEVVKAASSLATILFKNLFPPKPKTFQYASLEPNCAFSWFFRQDQKGDSAPVSILGLHTAAALLRTSSAVKKIRVRHSVLTRWNSKLGDKTEFNFVGSDKNEITIPPKPDAPSLSDASDLSDLPVMVAKSDAMKILHVEEPEYKTLITDVKNGFKTVANGDFVSRSSLEAFLGLTRKREEK